MENSSAFSNVNTIVDTTADFLVDFGELLGVLSPLNDYLAVNNGWIGQAD